MVRLERRRTRKWHSILLSAQSSGARFKLWALWKGLRGPIYTLSRAFLTEKQEAAEDTACRSLRSLWKLRLHQITSQQPTVQSALGALSDRPGSMGPAAAVSEPIRINTRTWRAGGGGERHPGKSNFWDVERHRGGAGETCRTCLNYFRFRH